MVLALTILSIRKLHQCGNLPGAKGLLPPGLTYSLFSGKEQSRRLASGHPRRPVQTRNYLCRKSLSHTFCLGPLVCIIRHFYGKSYYSDIICSIGAVIFYFPLIVLFFHGFLNHVSIRATTSRGATTSAPPSPPSHPPTTL